MQNVRNADADMKRFRAFIPNNLPWIFSTFYIVSICRIAVLTRNKIFVCFYFHSYRFLDEKEKSLEEALNQINVLKRDLAGKDAEVGFIDRD